MQVKEAKSLAVCPEEHTSPCAPKSTVKLIDCILWLCQRLGDTVRCVEGLPSLAVTLCVWVWVWVWVCVFVCVWG